MDPVAAQQQVLVQRGLRLLEYQRRASRAYYARHRDDVKARSVAYWQANRDAINERRRLRYALRKLPVEESELK